MTNITALIDQLRAALADADTKFIGVSIARKDAANLLRILEFVEAMKIETTK